MPLLGRLGVLLLGTGLLWGGEQVGTQAGRSAVFCLNVHLIVSAAIIEQL